LKSTEKENAEIITKYDGCVMKITSLEEKINLSEKEKENKDKEFDEVSITTLLSLNMMSFLKTYSNSIIFLHNSNDHVRITYNNPS
jgi:hypothetical protein